MADFNSTRGLKLEVLERAGEPTGGTSKFEVRVIELLNNAYRGLFSGGTEFDIDINDPWPWAKAERPIILTLQPAYETGTVTLTEDSYDGTFSSAPTLSQEGRYLKVGTNPDIVRIRKHTAGETAFEIDQPYPDSSGSYTFKSIKLDYDIVDDTVIIDSRNNRLDFGDTAAGEFTASLTAGVYSVSDFISHVKTQMEAVGGGTYTISFNSITRKFTLASDQAAFFLDFGSGSNVYRSVAPSMGFSVADLTGATSYEADISLNAISRLVRPLTVHRSVASNTTALEGSYRIDPTNPVRPGSIFYSDFGAFQLEHPVGAIQEGIPDKFTELGQSDNGIVTIQFNRYPSEKIRVEIEAIQLGVPLADNVNSVPKVPIAFRDYLVHNATYYMHVRKADNKAAEEKNLAIAKLRAMKGHNRIKNKNANPNYGRIIPRRR